MVAEPEPPSLNGVVAYRSRYIRHLRLLVRMKILQLGVVGFSSIPLAYWLSGSSASAHTLLLCSSLAVGSGIAAYTVQYLSSRYIGELSLSSNHVCVSTMDFWGNRVNRNVDLKDIDPPFAHLTPDQFVRLPWMTDNGVIPFNVGTVPFHIINDKNERHTFLLSGRGGRVMNRPAFVRILTGKSLENTS